MSSTATATQQTGYALKFEKDVAIAVSDGLVLRANVFRPDAGEEFPVVLALSPYGKDAHFRDAYKPQWEHLNKLYPDVARNGSTGRYLRWETADPERWVPHGYVLIHVDARGSGKSPGYLDPRSARETFDLYESIEWRRTSRGRTAKSGCSAFRTMR